MATIIIKPGDTLSKLGQQAGMNWQDIWKANPNIKDPNLIKVGQTLNIPDKADSVVASGSLEKTLPPATSPVAQGEKTLPTAETPAVTKPDSFTNLRLALREASRIALNRGVNSGRGIAAQGLESAIPGFGKGNISGGTFANIIDSVNKQYQPSIQDEFTNMIDTVNSIQKQKENLTVNSQKQIDSAINNGMWQKMDASQKQTLWEAAGNTGTAPEATGKLDTSITEINGRKVLINNQNGEIIKSLGSVAAPGNGDTLTEKKDTRVKQIVAMNPNEWGKAADQIDVEFGAGTATKYDSYLKSIYAPESAKPVSTEKISELQDKVTQIDSLMKDPGLSGAVGPNWMTRDLGMGALTGNKQRFIGNVQQLVSRGTLDSLLALKAQGGTLGALSDQERVMLESAATKIGNWTMRDDNMNVIGYNIDEKSFMDELNTLKTLTQRAINAAGGNSKQNQSNSAMTDEQAYQEYLNMIK